jgi:hypothetical protein
MTIRCHPPAIEGPDDARCYGEPSALTSLPTQIGCAILKLPVLHVRGCDPELFGL